mgnify:CR=1 FL=1
MNHPHSTSAREEYTGTSGDDVIHGDGGSDWIRGWGGDDLLTAMDATGEAGLWGNRGDDTLIGRVAGHGQIHMSGAEGNDHIVMDVTNDVGLQGHHVYGGKGADKFEFTNVADANVPIIGRIDDFDASQDSIWIDGNEIDLFNLPNGVDVVEYQDQFWLKIGDNVLYALEGARDGGDERHFPLWPEEVDALKVVTFADHVNHVPFELFEDEVEELNALYARGVETNGTSGDDWIYDSQLNRYNSDGELTHSADSMIHGGAGNDVIEAGKGNDYASGGSGNDFIAGGQDSDHLFGNTGDDEIWGGSENDWVSGGSGNDTLHGGSGNDILYGKLHNDILYGDSGNDALYGGHGDDRLSGDSGNDRVFGGLGDDTVRGGMGRDTMNGGAGSDVFEIHDGDLVKWADTSGTMNDRIDDLDIIQDFDIGQDILSFENQHDVNDMSDLKIWKVEIDQNVMFMLQIPSTNERLLVDVHDDTDWDDMMDEANYDFM